MTIGAIDRPATEPKLHFCQWCKKKSSAPLPFGPEGHKWCRACEYQRIARAKQYAERFARK